MGIPELQPRRYRFIELPEAVWKVQLLPERVPVPEKEMETVLSGGLPYEKLHEFMKSFVLETENYQDSEFIERALQVYEFGTQAIGLHRQEKFKEAIKYYQKALDLEPGSWICAYNKAFCFLQLNELEKAKEVLHQAVESLSSEPRNYALLGDIWVQEKKYVRAFGAYHQFLRRARAEGLFPGVRHQLCFQLSLLEEREPRLSTLHPWPVDGRCICGETWNFPEVCPGSEEGSPHRFKDTRFARTSDWTLQDSLHCEVCEQSMEGYACPDCGREYHWALGTLKSYHPMNEYLSIPGSYFDFGGEDKRPKSDVDAVVEEVSFMILEFRYQDALNLLQQSRQIFFDMPIFHYKYCEILKLLGKEMEGLTEYENVLNLRADAVNAQYALGLLTPNPTMAVKIFQDLLLNHPTFAPAFTAIGDLLLDEGRTQEALEYYHRSLEADPSWTPTYRSLSQAYQQGGDEAQAVHFRNVLHKLSPYFDDRHENSYLAYAGRLKSQKEYARANQVLSSISEIARAAVRSEEQKLHYELGFEPWLRVKKISNLLQMGKTWMAGEVLGGLTKAIEKSNAKELPGDSHGDLRLNLIKTLIDEGLNEEAQAYLEKSEKDENKKMDPYAVEWLRTYEQDKRKMHLVHSGDKTLSLSDVASFSIRTVAEVRGNKKGNAVFIDGEGLLLAPQALVGMQKEVEVVTYDGLILPARVVFRSKRAPFVFLKAPPLAEGVYFHFDVEQVPILKADETVLVVGQDLKGDFFLSESKIQQDLTDSIGVRYLVLDRPAGGEVTSALVVTQRGAVLGMTFPIESTEEAVKSRLVIDADEITRAYSHLKKDYGFIYQAAFCNDCGRRLRLRQAVCACGNHQKANE